MTTTAICYVPMQSLRDPYTDQWPEKCSKTLFPFVELIFHMRILECTVKHGIIVFLDYVACLLTCSADLQISSAFFSADITAIGTSVWFVSDCEMLKLGGICLAGICALAERLSGFGDNPV